IKKNFDATTAKDFGLDIDPVGTLRKEFESAVGDLPATPLNTAPTPPPVDSDASGASGGPVVPPVIRETAPPIESRVALPDAGSDRGDAAALPASGPSDTRPT